MLSIIIIRFRFEGADRIHAEYYYPDLFDRRGYAHSRIFEPDMVRIERMMQHIADTFPEITSLLYIVNQKRNDTIADQKSLRLSGKLYLGKVWKDYDSR